MFREYASMTGFRNNGLRDLDISPLATLSDTEYDQLMPQQWPLKTVDAKTTQKRFFAEGRFYTATGKANIVPVNYRVPMANTSPDFPLVLNTGRIRDHWHTMTRTGLVSRLSAHKPEPYVIVHPQDARCFQLAESNIAELYNHRGRAKARVNISPQLKPGQCFMPMHWTAVNSSEGRVGPLIAPNIDPLSGQPELKCTPIAIKPWHYCHEALVIAREPLPIQDIDYWSQRKIDGGYLYYLAVGHDSLSLVDTIKQWAPFTAQGNVLTFDSPATDSYRAAKVNNNDLLAAYIVAPTVNSHHFAWLDGLFQQPLDSEVQRSSLSGEATAALLIGKQICACKQVGE